MHPTNCLNCSTNLAADQHFCPQCGQKAAVHRISFHDIWHDAVHYFTHADKGIFFLVGQLAVRPGQVAREFLAGRRTKYFKPFNFFLIVAGLVVFMTTRFHVIDDGQANRMEAKVMKVQDPVKRAQYLQMVHRMRQTNEITSKYSNFLHMLATPATTLFFWLFYYRGRYNFAEHLVANMYFVSMVSLIYALFVVPMNALLRESYWITVGFFFLLELVYRALAYYQLMPKRGAGPLLKALGVSLLAIAFWAGATGVLIAWYIQTGFK